MLVSIYCYFSYHDANPRREQQGFRELGRQADSAGIAVPDEPSEFAARFVGLGTDAGLRYQLQIVEILFPEEVIDEARSQIGDAAEAAARWISTSRGREAVDSSGLRQLDELWRALGVRLVGLAPDGDIAATVARLHGA